VTHLRKLMLDELQRRNYAQNTVRSYIHAVEDFANYFRRSPDRLGPNHIREYQVHLFRDCKLSAGTIEGRTAAAEALRHGAPNTQIRAGRHPRRRPFWIIVGQELDAAEPVFLI